MQLISVLVSSPVLLVTTGLTHASAAAWGQLAGHCSGGGPGCGDSAPLPVTSVVLLDRLSVLGTFSLMGMVEAQEYKLKQENTFQDVTASWLMAGHWPKQLT